MTATAHRRWRHMLAPVRVVRARPRLFASALFGAIAVASMPSAWRIATRLLVGWDLGAGLYLALAYHLMSTARLASIRLRAKLEDEGQFTILALTSAAAFASLGAILAELGAYSGAGAARPPSHLALAIVTIATSWTFTHTIFALHYAHDFYQEGGSGRGLAFPGEEQPDYWDFVYFSFVIGMTSQVSDVAITSKRIRRTAAAHGAIAFVFNTTLLALTVNIAASAL